MSPYRKYVGVFTKRVVIIFCYRFKINADRQLRIEFPEHLSPGTGNLQQTPAVSGNGSADYSQL